MTKGAAFALASPTPALQRFFPDDDVCEELASVLHLVPEAANLCVWTRGAPARNALILPYVASTDLDLGAAADARRDLHLFFQGGCGNPAPEVRGLFGAGKMLRWELVQALGSPGPGGAPPPADVHARCACDICEGHLPHAEVLAAMRRAVFCPIIASNAQSSRRLSEAVLSGCIPVGRGHGRRLRRQGKRMGGGMHVVGWRSATSGAKACRSAGLGTVAALRIGQGKG